MKEKYPGIKGNIQGEKKESNPVANAAEYDMVSLNIFILKNAYIKCHKSISFGYECLCDPQH